MDQQRKEVRERRRREAEASPARLLSQRLSKTHTPIDLERMTSPLFSTPSPELSSRVGVINRIEAAQR